MLAAMLCKRIGQADNPGPGFDDPEVDDAEQIDDDWHMVREVAQPPEENEHGPPVPMTNEDVMGVCHKKTQGKGRSRVVQRVEAAPNDVQYVAAKTFEGPVQGWVFQNNEEGVGYYRDNGFSLKSKASSEQQVGGTR